MDDLSASIDQKNCGAEFVENIGKGGGFGLPEIDDFAGAHGSSHMRHDEFRPPTHFIVDHAHPPRYE